MKKTTFMALAAFAILSMSSCKKDRTCTCTSSTNGTSSSSTSTIVVTHATKNAALGGNCASTTDTYVTGNGTTKVDVRTCTLK